MCGVWYINILESLAWTAVLRIPQWMELTVIVKPYVTGLCFTWRSCFVDIYQSWTHLTLDTVSLCIFLSCISASDDTFQVNRLHVARNHWFFYRADVGLWVQRNYILLTSQFLNNWIIIKVCMVNGIKVLQLTHSWSFITPAQ